MTAPQRDGRNDQGSPPGRLCGKGPTSAEVLGSVSCLNPLRSCWKLGTLSSEK